jgi:biotin carboxyl carrier protein
MAAPSAMAEIMPTFRAQVVAVLVRPGQRVTPGMPVLTVLMPEVLRAAGSYQGAALRIAAYQQRREQLLSLKSEGLLRVADLSESEARLAEAKATQLEALATLQAASLSPGEAAGLTGGGGRVSLRSPVAGVVTSVQASLGQVTDGGTALIKIAGSGEVRIEARLLFGLPAHARYELVLPSGARRLLTLSDRSPQLDSRDGTVQAWLMVAQPTAAPTDPAAMTDLPPGLVGKLQVYVDEADATLAQAVLVPARALLLKNSRAHVLRRLAKGDHELLPVQVLLTTGADALVKATTGKLSIGDEVATDASLYAGDGASETAGEP